MTEIYIPMILQMNRLEPLIVSVTNSRCWPPNGHQLVGVFLLMNYSFIPQISRIISKYNQIITCGQYRLSLRLRLCKMILLTMCTAANLNIHEYSYTYYILIQISIYVCFAVFKQVLALCFFSMSSLLVLLKHSL